MSVCAKFQQVLKFVVVGWCGVVWGGFQVSTMYNLNPRCIEMELGLGFDNYSNEISCNWEKKTFAGESSGQLSGGQLSPT